MDKIKNTVTVLGGQVYVVRDLDDIINCDSTAGPIKLYLANIRGSGFTLNQKQYYINDVSGTAGINAISIEPTGGDTINGTTGVGISDNGGTATIQLSGHTEWLCLIQSPNGSIDGGGTVNTVAGFTPNGNTVGNTPITWSGTKVGINTPVPTQPLQLTTPTESYGVSVKDGVTELATYMGDMAGTKYCALGTTTDSDLIFTTNDDSRVYIKKATGRVGILNANPTAYLHIASGSATAGSAPFKYSSGVLLSTPEPGAKEFEGDNEFLTITTGSARKGIVLDNGARLVTGRFPIATTNGRLIDSGFTANSLVSGTFTPTVTVGTNVSAVSAFTCWYIRVGNIVYVGGRVDVDPITAGLGSSFRMSLPIASNFTNFQQAGGTGSSPIANYFWTCYSLTATDDVSCEFTAPTNVASNATYFQYSYQVL